MSARSRFTIRGLMLFVAAVACYLAARRALGLVLGAFLTVLVICYALASLLSTRTRMTCAALSALFAVLPWLGLGYGSFVLMGTPDLLLPTIDLPLDIQVPLSWLYWFAETPLYVTSEYSDEFADFICFAGEGAVTVRPFVVFVFWLGFTVTFFLSITSPFVTRRQRVISVPENREKAAPKRQSASEGR